jgi:hypothetical protein
VGGDRPAVVNDVEVINDQFVAALGGGGVFASTTLEVVMRP